MTIVRSDQVAFGVLPGRATTLSNELGCWTISVGKALGPQGGELNLPSGVPPTHVTAIAVCRASHYSTSQLASPGAEAPAPERTKPSKQTQADPWRRHTTPYRLSQPSLALKAGARRGRGPLSLQNDRPTFKAVAVIEALFTPVFSCRQFGGGFVQRTPTGYLNGVRSPQRSFLIRPAAGVWALCKINTFPTPGRCSGRRQAGQLRRYAGRTRPGRDWGIHTRKPGGTGISLTPPVTWTQHESPH